MSRLYDTEEALNLILSDDGDADSSLLSLCVLVVMRSLTVTIENYSLSTRGICDPL